MVSFSYQPKRANPSHDNINIPSRLASRCDHDWSFIPLFPGYRQGRLGTPAAANWATELQMREGECFDTYRLRAGNDKPGSLMLSFVASCLRFWPCTLVQRSMWRWTLLNAPFWMQPWSILRYDCKHVRMLFKVWGIACALGFVLLV